MKTDRLPYWNLWREIADYYLPSRYTWLQTDAERKVRNAKNPFILDPTGTAAARTLASGMMNGVTSPSRPWFKLRIAGYDDEASSPVRIWLDEVTRRMLLVMAESNFYNSMAILYLDLVVFGTASMLIYADEKSTIRCYNPSLGEFYIANGDRMEVTLFSREFTYKLHQIVSRFGEENLHPTLLAEWKSKGISSTTNISITHLIQPDFEKKYGFEFKECYWITGAPKGYILQEKGYHELPGIFPRWELSGNDAYGTCPAMDALGDVIQLQHETKKKAMGLDKLISPPIVADIQLQHRPTALLPNGITFVTGVNNVGAKPLYQIAIPLGEMTLDIRDVQGRIRETFHNDLFRMISQLDTVRSATEIDARREEKLVLLGSVLERFDNEALDPGINRIYNIMLRSGLIPEAPAEIGEAELEIQYVSILSAAQRAVGVLPTERWLQLIGTIAPIYPKAVNIPNFDQILRDYGRDIGVAARGIRSIDEVNAENQKADKLAASREAAATGQVLVDSAKSLSETQITPGSNALQQIIGG
jgi:hypothetical protein